MSIRTLVPGFPYPFEKIINGYTAKVNMKVIIHGDGTAKLVPHGDVYLHEMIDPNRPTPVVKSDRIFYVQGMPYVYRSPVGNFGNGLYTLHATGCDGFAHGCGNPATSVWSGYGLKLCGHCSNDALNFPPHRGGALAAARRCPVSR